MPGWLLACLLALLVAPQDQDDDCHGVLDRHVPAGDLRVRPWFDCLVLCFFAEKKTPSADLHYPVRGVTPPPPPLSLSLSGSISSLQRQR